MKYLSHFLAILLFGVTPAFSQSSGGGTIKGNLIGPDGLSVPGASVFVKVGGQLRGDYSNIDGKFTVKPIPTGEYDLYITSVGYDTLIVQDVRVISDRITMLKNQHLQYRTMGVVEVITHEIDLIQIDEPSVITYGAKDLERLPDRTNVGKMISTMTPGTYQRDEGDPLQFRGARAGASTYFVDGVKTNDLSSGIPGAGIGTIRVYTGGIPAMYGDVVGGVVVIESKSFMSWYQKANRNR